MLFRSGAAELEAELPDLRRTLAVLGGVGDDGLPPERFLELLRQRARCLEEANPQPAADLTEAIRAELLATPQG